MTWTELLESEIQYTYAIADKLLARVDDGSLHWKPSTGANWMTTGQLLKHLSTSCGAAFEALKNSKWDIAGESGMQLPSAEKLPSVESIAEARRLVDADRRLALELLASWSEEELAHTDAPVPWDYHRMVLGRRLLQLVDHLKQHKGQLFYYLKLQGKPVSTPDLWGE